VVLPAAKDGRILVPGCGDSLLSEKLALQMGFQDVVSVDFEPDVITRMQSRGTKGVTYEVVDITQMKYETGFFASILDKGTFDALCVDMKPETTLQCTKYLAESVRVLKNGGSFLAVSLL
jgi:ubiquinone/menaquinone biosynthesis C-methylase UbiE